MVMLQVWCFTLTTWSVLVDRRCLLQSPIWRCKVHWCRRERVADGRWPGHRPDSLPGQPSTCWFGGWYRFRWGLLTTQSLGNITLLTHAAIISPRVWLNIELLDGNWIPVHMDVGNRCQLQGLVYSKTFFLITKASFCQLKHLLL